MHIAILGTGHMATTLGSAILAAGHTVVFGSREPAAHTSLDAPVTSVTDAIEGSDLVLNALQAAFTLDALSVLGSALDGRIVLDIGNAVTPRMELMYPNSSLGTKLQEALPAARIVKSLNTLAGTVTAEPGTLPAPTSVFLSGDDDEAKAVVSGLLSDLGWPAAQQIDLGGIESARGPEHYFVLFATMMQSFRNPNFNISVVR